MLFPGSSTGISVTAGAPFSQDANSPNAKIHKTEAELHHQHWGCFRRELGPSMQQHPEPELCTCSTAGDAHGETGTVQSSFGHPWARHGKEQGWARGTCTPNPSSTHALLFPPQIHQRLPWLQLSGSSRHLMLIYTTITLFPNTQASSSSPQ